MKEEWRGFTGGNWEHEVDVRDFIQKNYRPYEGDASFLSGPTKRTTELWNTVLDLLIQERERGGALDMDTDVVTGIVSHPAGYIDNAHPEREAIVGLQTDKPLKRALHVNGGVRISMQAAEQHGYHIDPEIVETYTYHRKTHNAGVFDVYTPEMRACRSAHIITGLPDGYGRGRIIGDYRRVALYGVDFLIEDKKAQKASTPVVMTEENIRDREELQEQIRALGELKMMADFYGFDISRPAANTQEAIQWTYFAYLAAVKEQNGAAMSMGRTSSFIDIYAERDLAAGSLSEEQIQELVDHFIMKLRMVKFARTPEYQNLFSGDPQWVTESIGGMGVDGRTLVTKTAFRYLHTLENMGTSPEPNLTVLWSTRLPQPFKEFCARTSIASSSIQYENDDLMRVYHGDDYAIACCVSSMRIGKEMQFFGARANLAKCLLYALNGGVDEVSKKQVGPKYRPVSGDTLDYDDVIDKFDDMMEWLASVYVNSLNIIHYMHDKYCYERIQMALHDKHVHRWFATGIAGLSVVADSLSAIKYAKVHPVRDSDGIIVDFKIEGDFPKFGNDDDRVDRMAHDVVHQFMEFVRMNDTYRNSVPTTSVLTITSNVVYGKKTGSTPDGREAGVPFAPGANPMHKRDSHGAIASLSSVSKLPFHDAQDGISNTFSIVPAALGKPDQVFFGDIDLDGVEISLENAACGACADDPSAPEDAIDLDR
ncbi:formate acetyltransferase [Coriobacterium glomerans PW2]|uniref:Formate acetyltransferase n=1 Tax=Coriobacterium glomerans (strain ATCC 49209 / DSM 20642 / JCM 10262 / PW2) TaxID=700015 RepID=F2NAZ8_CORGP|nr:formate C-acetyltransferase [Coriobacterium glomerans]AEB07676.1 formate acetyltransferase [Coriobacterium glomerans PW2]